MVEVNAVRLDKELPLTVFNRLLACVTTEKREKIHRFHHYIDAERALLGDVLARYSLCKRLGKNNSELLFGANEYGKPCLLNTEKIFFNISHSGRWIVCCLDHCPVGIDVELIQPMDPEIAKRFFSEEEYMDLLEKEERHRMPYFFELWTLKESYIKAEGRGLSIPLKSFTIKIQDGNISVKTLNDFRCRNFKQYPLDTEYKLAVCAAHVQFAAEINMVGIMDLCAVGY